MIISKVTKCFSFFLLSGSVFAAGYVGLDEPAVADRIAVNARNNRVRLDCGARLDADSPINVLSIDGGGVRGVIPAVCLQLLEERTEKTVRELFDLVVGTSTGAILSLGLVVDEPLPGPIRYRTARDMVGIYTDLSSRIFPERWRVRKAVEFLPSFFYGYQYSPRPLEDSLREHFSTKVLGNTFLPTLVTTVRAGYNKLRLFRSYRDATVSVREVARATSAAPTYFPIAKIGDERLIDGGMAANNPSVVALAEAYSLFHGRRINLVSLGTGECVQTVSTSDIAYVRRAAPTINTLFDAQSDAAHSTISDLASARPELSYRRIQLSLPSDLMELDKSSNCGRLQEMARVNGELEGKVRDVSRTLISDRF
jgi:predicted acylesterase/phospholipase RssA